MEITQLGLTLKNSQVKAENDLLFDSIVAPMTVKNFTEEYFRKKPLVIKGGDNKFFDIMNWKLLSDLLNQSAIWSPYSLNLYSNTRAISADEYSYPSVTREGNEGRLINFDQVAKHVKNGSSLVLNDIETLNPGLKAVAHAIESTFLGKVQANLYCSRSENQALPVHFDTHDVFAIQVEGSKQWRVYGTSIQKPINHHFFKSIDQSFHEANKGELSIDEELTSGDFIYIPRGFYHEAMCHSDSTVHVSYSCVPVIGIDLLTAFFDVAVNDELFRDAIPNQDEKSGKKLEEHMTRLVGRMRNNVLAPEFQEPFKDALKNYTFDRYSVKLPDDFI